MRGYAYDANYEARHELFLNHRGTQKKAIRPLVMVLEDAGVTMSLNEEDHVVTAPITKDIVGNLRALFFCAVISGMMVVG